MVELQGRIGVNAYTAKDGEVKAPLTFHVKFKETLQKATRWHKANNLRNYINEVESRILANNKDHEDISSWLAWARSKADWYDPFLEKDDELLANIVKNTLLIKTPINKYGWLE